MSRSATCKLKLYLSGELPKKNSDYGVAGQPLVVCEVVCRMEGQSLMLDDSVAKPAEEFFNKIFNPKLLQHDSHMAHK